MTQEEVETKVEEVILEMKKNFGIGDLEKIEFVNASDKDFIKVMIFTNGLCKIHNKDYPNIIHLNKKGWRFTTFENERDKSIIEDKLKKVSLESITLNKWLPVYAIIIAVIAAVVPFIIYGISRNDAVSTNTTILQLQKMQETEEHMQQILEKKFDSLLKVLNQSKKD